MSVGSAGKPLRIGEARWRSGDVGTAGNGGEMSLVYDMSGIGETLEVVAGVQLGDRHRGQATPRTERPGGGPCAR